MYLNIKGSCIKKRDPNKQEPYTHPLPPKRKKKRWLHDKSKIPKLIQDNALFQQNKIII